MSNLTLDQAAVKAGIEKKRLVGFCMRNDFDDPIVVECTTDGDYLVADDWRLDRLSNSRPANKAEGEA